MCGRYTLTDPDPRYLKMRFDVSEKAKVSEKPRFNIAPTDSVLAIREHDGERDFGRLRWGLVRPGETPKSVKRPIINLRAETVKNGAFKSAFEERRCLVPADGFYEWRKDEDGKRPIWITLPDHELFAFAGLWSESKDDDGNELISCTIITTEPTEEMRPIHNRMPAILPREAEGTWLAPDADLKELGGLLAGYDGLEFREVSDLVNSVSNDSPELIERYVPEPKLF